MKKYKECLLEKWSKVLAFYYSSNTLRLIAYAETNIKIHGIDSDGNLTPKGKSVSLVQFYYSKGMEEEAKFLKQQH